MHKTLSGREITFIGDGDEDIKVTGINYYGIHNLNQLFGHLLRDGWNQDTVGQSLKPIYDHANNPAKGQCSITSALVQDIFGGELARVYLPDGRQHSINRIDGRYIDLTSDQFTIDGLDALGGEIKIISRDECLRDMSMVARYNKLSLKLCQSVANDLAADHPDTLKRSDLPNNNYDNIVTYLRDHDNTLPDDSLFSTFGQRDDITKTINDGCDKEDAKNLFVTYATGNTQMTSASLVHEDNRRQFLVNDNIYKRSGLICNKERLDLLALADKIEKL